jgi:hypothetical protein
VWACEFATSRPISNIWAHALRAKSTVEHLPSEVTPKGIPSAYLDRYSTLCNMKARWPNVRGVAVIGDKTPESDLDSIGRPESAGSHQFRKPEQTTPSSVAASRQQSSG